MSAEIPTLPAYQDADGIHVLVWCMHCRRYHRHRGPITAVPRIAHCATDGEPSHRDRGMLEDAGLTAHGPTCRATAATSGGQY